MRRFFSFWSSSLARLFSSTAIAVTLFGAVNVHAAIIVPANPNVQPVSSLPVGTELLVEMNQDFVVYPDLDTENTGCPTLPPLSPDESQTSDANTSTSDTVAQSYRSGQRSNG